jgi:hypothetical protein
MTLSVSGCSHSTRSGSDELKLLGVIVPHANRHCEFDNPPTINRGRVSVNEFIDTFLPRVSLHLTGDYSAIPSLKTQHNVQLQLIRN